MPRCRLALGLVVLSVLTGTARSQEAVSAGSAMDGGTQATPTADVAPRPAETPTLDGGSPVAVAPDGGTPPAHAKPPEKRPRPDYDGEGSPIAIRTKGRTPRPEFTSRRRSLCSRS